MFIEKERERWGGGPCVRYDAKYNYKFIVVRALVKATGFSMQKALGLKTKCLVCGIIVKKIHLYWNIKKNE